MLQTRKEKHIRHAACGNAGTIDHLIFVAERLGDVVLSLPVASREGTSIGLVQAFFTGYIRPPA
jgi:hypothetical protein